MEYTAEPVYLEAFYDTLEFKKDSLKALVINVTTNIETPVDNIPPFSFAITYQDLAYLNATIEFSVEEAGTSHYDRDIQYYCRIENVASLTFPWQYPSHEDPRFIDHLVYEWFPAKLNAEGQTAWRNLIEKDTDADASDLVYQITEAIQKAMISQWQSTPLVAVKNLEMIAYSASSLHRKLKQGTVRTIPDYIEYEFQA